MKKLITARTFVAISLFSLLIFFSTARAEVFTWVDENGKKHYGDQIPDKYKEQTEEVDVDNVNTVPLKEVNESTKDILKSEKKKTKPFAYYKRQKNKQTKEKKQKKALTCEQKKAEYTKSKKCFSYCRNRNGTINAGKCPHCKSVKKPDC